MTSVRHPFPNPLLIEFVDAPFKKNRRFKLTEPFIYDDGTHFIKIDPPYHTDFASIPRIFWSILPPVGLYGKAAVVHDYLCDVCKECNYQYDKFDIKTRGEADKIFLDAMTLLKVAGWKRYPMYWAVRAAGTLAEFRTKHCPANPLSQLLMTKEFLAISSVMRSRVFHTSFLFSMTLLILLIKH